MNRLPYVKFNYAIPEKCISIAEYVLKDTPRNTIRLEVGDAYTTVEDNNLPPHCLPSFQWIKEIVHAAAEFAYDISIDKTETDSYITNSWMNKHYRTGQTIEHIHGGVEFAVVIYLTVPKNSGNFELFYNDKWNVIEVESNDVLVFPGNILHRTQESQSDEPRIVISVNTSRSNYIHAIRTRDMMSLPMEDMFKFMRQSFEQMAIDTDQAISQLETRLVEM